MEMEREIRDREVKKEAMAIVESFQVLPRLVVFDLDYTLWPFFCSSRSKREMPSLYPQAKGIICALKEKGIDLAIASRAPTADTAVTFLDKLGIRSMFITREVFFSWTKRRHFQRIYQSTGVPFDSMLFFDDEQWNTETVSKMGVTSTLVGNGVNCQALRQGLTKFAQNFAEIKLQRRNPLVSAFFVHKPRFPRIWGECCPEKEAPAMSLLQWPGIFKARNPAFNTFCEREHTRHPPPLGDKLQHFSPQRPRNMVINVFL